MNDKELIESLAERAEAWPFYAEGMLWQGHVRKSVARWLRNRAAEVEVLFTPEPEPSDKPVWQDAWREFQDPYLGPDTEKFPSRFESFVAGFLAARVSRRDGEDKNND